MVGTLRDPSHPVDEELKVGARKRPAGAGEIAPPAALGSDPARAASMQAQMSQPVYKGEAGVQDAYSSNPLLRGMQETADSNNQRRFTQQANRADALRETVDRETGRALATAYDKGAAYNKAVSLTAPMADQYEAMRQSGELQAAIDGASRNRPIATPGPATPGIGSRAVDYAQGVGQLAAGVVSAPATTAIDLGRAGIAWLDGSELANPNAARDVSGKLMYDGVNNIDQALDGSRGIVRDLIGAKPTQPSDGGSAAAAPVSPPKPTDKPGSTNKPSAATQGDGSGGQAASQVAAAGGSEWQSTGFGRDQAGGEIFMRVGADGVPEFTNETATPGAASGAQSPKAGYGTTRPTQSSAPGNMTAPSGARVLASGSRTPDTEFAALGSAANLGNGVGGFSQNTAGSAALALERFGRANEIRAGTQRPRELGDNGGRLTVVRDSSRAPTMADLQNAKLDARQAQTADIRERTAQSTQQQQRESMNSAVDRQLRSLEAAQAQLGLADRQRLSELQQSILDPSIPAEQRRALAEQYRVLSGKKSENRFTVVPGGQAINEQGVAYTLPSTVINNQTGEFVQQGNAGQAFRTSVSRDEVAQTARSRGISEEEVIQALKAKGVSVNG